MYIDKIKNTDLMDMLKIFNSIYPFDIDEFYKEALLLLKFYKDGTSSEKSKLFIHDIQKQWYDSLVTNSPDYEIYNHTKYILDLWSCWKLYSRKYVKLITSSLFEYLNKFNIKSILDVGCGIGYSTMAFKELFKCDLYATNSVESYQYQFNKIIFKGQNIKLAADSYKFGTIDILFASEYFEHFLYPIEHLINILDANNPRFIIVANAFGAISSGHFNYYYVGSKRVINKKIGRIFNQTLYSRGYKKINTGFFNNRPSVFEKIEVQNKSGFFK